MKLRLPIYTLMHFLVDLTCIYRLYVLVMPQSGPYENWLVMVVLYNFLAFALPGLVGAIADVADTSDSMAAVGCILVAIPAWISFHALPIVVLQGIGNGFFHVGAGRKVLLDSQGAFAPSGIFISSGAMGVFLGTIWKHEYRPTLSVCLAVSLLICACILFRFCCAQRKEKSGQRPVMKTSVGEERFVTLPVLMILLVVILRSFYGTCVSYEWKNSVIRSFIFVACIVAGKALGGIVADWLGVRLTAIASVGGAAITVLFSEHSPFLGYISILLFNMTMPLTLSLIAGYWNRYPGFAFGILMVALFIGTLPDLILGDLCLSMPGLCIVSLISLLGLLLGIGRNRGGMVT